MQEHLQRIVDDTPGAKASILMGFDGIAVDSYSADDADMDIESVAMEFSFRFIELRTAAETLELGELSDITIKAEFGTMLIHVLTKEYFVAVFLAEPGHFGKGRWLLRSVAGPLAAELA
jgi:predicted regulator of Ras-like GTPase activity (Roadblock/LC7/MglB family)